MLAWAKQREIIAASPIDAVPKPAKERVRERVLDDEEFAIVWQAADGLAFPIVTFSA